MSLSEYNLDLLHFLQLEEENNILKTYESLQIIIVEPHFVDGYDNTPMTPPISETTTLTRSPPLASSMSTTGENVSVNH